MFQPKSFILQWHVTNRCNWRCQHCYQENYSAKEMNLEELRGVLNQFVGLIKKWGLPRERAKIQITGGEPFLRQDFMQFLAGVFKFSSFFKDWAIMSNGSLMTKDIVKSLKFFGITAFQMSVEGLEKSNDEIRGPGAFQSVLKTAKLLKWADIRTTISLTLTRKNYRDLKQLAEIFSSPEFNVSRLSIRRIVPIGVGAQLKDLVLEPAELRSVYQEIEEINKLMIKNNRRLRTMGGCENAIYNDEISEPELMSFNHCGICDGRIITIMPNADVVICRRLPIKIGNLYESTLEEIYYSPVYESLRNCNDLDDDSPCRACANLQNCFGGAKCITHALTGKTTPDVQCWKLYNNLQESINLHV